MKKLLFSLAILFTICFAAHAQTYLERAQLAENDTFRLRVQIAMVTAAGNILADPTHEEEFSFAGRIVTEPNSKYFIDMFSYQVIANPAINGQSSDSDIAFTVNSNFTKLATEYNRQRSGG